MTKRDKLKKIAEEHLGETLGINWFKDNYPEFILTLDFDTSSQELDEKLIQGLLWDYKVTFTKTYAQDGTNRKIVKSVKISKLKNKSKLHKILEIAKPNDEGYSKINKEDWEKQKDLILKNGGSWCRDSSKLAELFKIKRIYNGTPITSVELCGWNREIKFSQRIKREIFDELKNQPCVFTGSNSNIEIDHKDGRKNNLSFNDIKNQKINWFQPTCKAMNDFKRQKCKECKKTGKRWKATNIKGNPIDFYKGGEDYKGTCEGCYLYDPVEYRLYYYGNNK